MRKKIIFICCILSVVFIYFWTIPHIDTKGTIKIYDRNNILLYESAENVGHKMPVTYNRLPVDVIHATIAAEDETFWTNPGIDLPAIIRSLYVDITHKKILTGASTITQQLARISYIAPHETFIVRVIRKIQEILIALRITTMYSKRTIITAYLNSVYYGNHAYGIQAASFVYFHKDVSQLSLAEASLLTGIISSPDKKNPYTHMDVAKKAQEEVLQLLVKDKLITKKQSLDAFSEHITLAVQHDSLKAPHFVDYILQEITSMGINQTQGIQVYTTLDYPLYELSNRIATFWVNNLKEEHDLSNAALVLLDNKTGEIIDMLGGINYTNAIHADQVNMATALRQPGSALKPITYATAFYHGYTPATLIYDVQKVYKTRTGEGFTPNNYDQRYHGLVLAREALASSLNLPAVEMLSRIGIPEFLREAHLLGITSLRDIGRYDLSLTLGGGEVSLLDLTNVYASFGRQGSYIPPYAIKTIVTDDNHIVYQHPQQKNIQAFGTQSKEIAYLLSSILSDPKARMLSFGEKNPLVLSHPAAVKTGTTTDWHDNWTVGYTPSYTVGVWVGNTDNHPMKNITGVVGAAPIWNQFFEEFLRGRPIELFSRPSDILSIEVCALTGSLPDGLCPDKKSELFITGTQPKKIVHYYKQVAIDSRNNLLATSACPKQFVLMKTFFIYPAEVYTWAIENNQEVIPAISSPLCTNQSVSTGSSYLAIIYPKEKSVFENAPSLIEHQILDLEANVSSDITKVTWFLDNKTIFITTSLPFTGQWIPSTGSHILYAIGKTNQGVLIQSNSVHFSIVNYKNNY